MEKKLRAYGYTRVSTKLQVDDGFSLEAQKNDIIDHAKKNNIEIVKWYSDEGVSGASVTGRKFFLKMLSDIGTGKDKIDYVVVSTLSRFGRSVSDNLSSYDYLKAHKVNLWAIKEKVDTSTPMSEFYMHITSALAALERESIKTQTMSGRFQKGRDGYWNGGIPPYGYGLKAVDRVKGKDRNQLVILEDEAIVVRKIFELFVGTNMGANGVADWLNKNGFHKKIRAKGVTDAFTPEFIKRTLDNPTYLGNMYYGRTKTVQQPLDKDGDPKATALVKRRVKQEDTELISICKNSHEAIISEELFEKAKKKRETTGHRYEKIEKDHTYILGTLVKCPVCGKSMSGVASHSKKKKGTDILYPPYYSYLCRGPRMKPPKCTYNTSFSASRLESEVVEIIKGLTSDPAIIDAVTPLIDSETDIQEVNYKIKEIESNIRKYEGAIKNEEARIDLLDSSDKHYYDKMRSAEGRGRIMV